MAVSKKTRESLEAYAYLAPAVLVLSIFWFIPVIVALIISFFDAVALTPPNEMSFVGLGQYRRAFADELFVQALWNTINYAIYSVPPTLVLSLAAAMLLNTQVKGRAFFRTAFFLPYITTWVAIAIVFNYIYHREFGLANLLVNIVRVRILGMPEHRVDWLGEETGIIELALGVNFPAMAFGIDQLLSGPSLALSSIIVTSVWRDIGYFMIIFLAGLQNIDRSYYEACDIDGATPWQKFRHITFPLLSPVSFFLLIIAGIGAFKEFVAVFVMTPDGGPAYTTAPIVFHMYKVGFEGNWNLSYAAAIAYILTAIILALTFLQNRVFGKRVEYDQ